MGPLLPPLFYHSAGSHLALYQSLGFPPGPLNSSHPNGKLDIFQVNTAPSVPSQVQRRANSSSLPGGEFVETSP